MEIYFANRLTTLPDLYAGLEDVPSLALSVHLHTWHFPDADGEAKFRVEIREGSTDPEHPLVGVAFVTATPKLIRAGQGMAPLSQAILDGLLSHEPIRHFFCKAAREALKLAENPEEKEAKVRIPLKKLKEMRR